MLKLYRFSELKKEYWETWEDGDGNHTIHWGDLGTRGQLRTIRGANPKAARASIQNEVDSLLNEGFAPKQDHVTLMIEYEVDGMGTMEDVEKRHRLKDRMNETLGWTGSARATAEASEAARWRCAISLLTSKWRGPLLPPTLRTPNSLTIKEFTPNRANKAAASQSDRRVIALYHLSNSEPSVRGFLAVPKATH